MFGITLQSFECCGYSFFHPMLLLDTPARWQCVNGLFTLYCDERGGIDEQIEGTVGMAKNVNCSACCALKLGALSVWLQ